MDTIYQYCAIIGGSLLLLQTLLLFLGAGLDTDVDLDDATEMDHAQASFLKALSLKTIVAFLTFFGLTGLAAQAGGLSGTVTLVLAIAAGTVALYLVAYVMANLSRLDSRGNIDLAHAVGAHGTVYLRIPPNKEGAGRIMVNVQGRRVECRAITAGPELPTGAEVTVLSVDSETLEVAAAG